MRQIETIISAIPDEAGFTDLDRSEARRLLLACVLWALPVDGPGTNSIEELKNLQNGYGSWLGWLRQAIGTAALEADERYFFLGAFGMATALQLSFSLPNQGKPRGRRKKPPTAGERHDQSDRRSAGRPRRVS